tara:strand:- start:5991 stop:6293 length:303 start_codon:yes stop_codon:yes gene_type:complete
MADKALEEKVQFLERFIEKRQVGFDKHIDHLYQTIDKLSHQIESCTCGAVLKDLLSPEAFTEKSINRLHQMTEAGEMLTPAEHHDERMAFAEECDDEGGE